MKSVLISVQPLWCEKIKRIIGQKDKTAIYEKSVEIRKTRPKIETPFKCYIYETKAIYKPSGSNHLFNGEGKVIGEFVCDEVRKISNRDLKENFRRLTKDIIAPSCLTVQELKDYLGFKDGYGWHISNLVIYDKPKELSEFITICPEWEKEYFDTKCLRCKYYFSNCADMRHECTVEGEKPITRPPQSWCYVEGGAEGGK